MRAWRRLIQVAAFVSLILSIRGFFFLADGLRRVRMHPIDIPEVPFFREVVLAMNCIDLTLLILMVVAAIGMLQVRRTAVRLYTWLYIAIIFYAFAPGAWSAGPVGRSIAAASGVGDLGIAPLIFYPIPFVYAALSVLLVNVAIRKVGSASTPSSESGPSGGVTHSLII